jgi:predicted dehydrogenase
MLEEHNIEVVIVNTPHYLHYPIVIDALDSGKHVLVDKPLAINLKEADKMIRKAEKKKLKLGVIFQSRFNPVFKKLKSATIAGKLGNLVLGDAVVKWNRTKDYYKKSIWRGCWATEGGGALINQAIHTIDLLLWIMGSPKYLWGQFDTFSHKIDVEDLAVAAIRFKNGALGIIEGSTAIYPGLPTKLAIHGTKGTVIVEGGSVKRWSILGEVEKTKEIIRKDNKSWSSPELLPAANHGFLISDFTRSVLEDSKPYVDGIEGRKSLELVEALYKSGKSQKRIDFPL